MTLWLNIEAEASSRTSIYRKCLERKRDKI